MNAAAVLMIASAAVAQVTWERIRDAAKEPGNWLTYSGTLASHRYSALDQINTSTVSSLRVAWVHQFGSQGKVETTPLVVDGVMYATRPPSDVVALDAATGRPYWTYRRALPAGINVCCGQVNRGVAILGDRVFVGTVDAHLVALDAKTGRLLWDVEVADRKTGHSVTVAPLIVENKVIVGIAGGEYGVRGFLDAYDPKDGRRIWRFWTVPGPGEKGHETWAGDSWKTGGGPTWVTGSYDPELKLIYWGTGNPSPDWNGDVRLGDNLYTSSVVALDQASGKLRWYFQFTPHDVHDWDAVQIPVLVDAEWNGRPRKLMYWANRNGFYYVLDRETGEFLLGKPFVKQTWASGLDDQGRPIRLPNTAPSREGTVVYPGVQGGTNWYSPSYSPRTGLFYFSFWDYASRYYTGDALYEPGNRYLGSVPNAARDEPSRGGVMALDPKTGTKKWEYPLKTTPETGILSTAGDVVFGGSPEGYFFALDARTGNELWRLGLGGNIAAGPISFLSGGKQYVAVAAGSAIFAFALP